METSANIEPAVDFATLLQTGKINLHNIPDWQHPLVFAIADWLDEYTGGGKREFTLCEGGSGPVERFAAAQRILFSAWQVAPTLKVRRGNLSGANFMQLHSPKHSFWVSVPGKPASNVMGVDSVLMEVLNNN